MKIEIKPLEPNQLQLLGAGDFYIGDPCYVFPQDYWSDFASAYYPNGDQGNKPARAVFIDGKFAFVTNNTAYGDGEYPVSFGLNVEGYFCVDAGVWSIIPVNNKSGIKINSEAGIILKNVNFNGAIWSEPEFGDFWIELFDGREIKIVTSENDEGFV